MTVKRKVSLTLDADLVDELVDESDAGLSAQVNEAVRVEIDRRRRRRALRSLLDEIALADGPLTAAELGEVARFEQLLGGA